MSSAIETHGLTRRFGQRVAVDAISMTVPERSIYGFLGRNGAGKTTTIKLLLGLLHADAGQARIASIDIASDRIGAARKVGALLEAQGFYPQLSGHQNLDLTRRLLGLPRQEIDRVLELTEMTAHGRRRVADYSLGMRQRLGLARAMLGAPPVLILDEPTNGLDPAGIQEMRSLISSMPETTGATVLISSHLLGEIEQMVTQVGILNHGKMLFEGSLQALQKHSRGGILLRVLDVPKSIAVLNRQGIRAVTQAQHPDVLELPALPDEALAALVSTLAENGVGVVGLTAQTKNLEEIFLSLTQTNGEVA